MSGGAAAKVTAGATKAAPAAAARTWSAPVSAFGEPRVATAHDPAEADADRLAERAIGSAARPPPPPRAPATPSGGPPPAPRLADAAREAQPLSTADRAFFEPRFGHRFDQVRIHAGPAAAAAAAAVRGQAFTLGRDIYFGAGEYRPGSQAGQGLLAHELAHTLQNRPNVIARRALDVPFSAPESEPGAGSEPPGAAGDDAATLIEAGNARGDGPTRDRLARLDPAARTDTLAALRARVPTADRDRVTTLGESLAPAAGAATPSRAPEVRQNEAPAATVAPRDAAPESPAAPAHQRATATASARMQEAARTVGAEAPAEGAPAVPGGLADTGTPAGGGAGGRPGGAAAAAAQQAVGLLSGHVAELAGARNQPVQFQDTGAAGDPEAVSRAFASQSLAAGFVGRAADKISAVLSAAIAVPGSVMGALGGATQAIAAQGTAQGAVLKAGADAARKQVREQAARVHGAIATRHSGTDRALAGDLQQARDRATRAQTAATGELGRRTETEKTRIALSYDNALQPLIGVGIEAGGLARDRAQARSQRLLSQRDGESSILDGPIHDNRLEANAEASVKVGDEYAKSFEKSAAEQADKLPESRPEVLGKVDEIAGQVRTGYASQATQIQQGADALDKGGTARSRQAATQMRASLDAQATQSGQAVDTAEQQHAGALQGQTDAAAAALDQAVAGSLTTFAAGVAQAAGQLTGSIHSFVESAAEIPAPPAEELSAALSEADPTPALDGMAAQIASVDPAMAGMLAEGQAGSGAALAAAAQAATQGFAGSASAFAQSAKGINQQAAVGFQRLGQGNKRSADSLGTDAEAGFAEAAQAADQAFSQFGDQVEDNFRKGRLQMRDGLWSPKTQADLDAAMEKYGQEAADHVQPRWKKVLKWVVTIVVIVAVIAVTVLSAGALGPVGVVLLGAALGAAAGAVQTIANNLIDGEPWSKGVVKAMIVGAVGGAVGGAGGVLLKGVGSVALKIGLEAGVNVIGGVAGEALGSVATGEPVNWTGALMGALVGAGIGAGLGIAGAIRGRIRVGGVGEPAAPAPPRPVIEPPPPAPAGRIRSALEAAKILAPRPGVVPEVNVGAGAGAGGEAAPAVETPGTPRQAGAPAAGEPPTGAPQPEAAVPPKRPIGFRTDEGTTPAAAEPAPGADAPRPRRPIGFDRGDAAPEPAATAEAPRPRRPIGFDAGEPAPEPQVGAEAPRPRRLIGFGRGEAVPEPAAGAAETPKPRRLIGFDRGEAAPEATAGAEATKPRRPIGFDRGEPAPEPQAGTGAPKPRRLIGFGRDETVPEAAGGGPSPDAPQAPPPPRPVVIEAPPRPAGVGGTEPAGGRSPLDIRASSEPPGVGGRPGRPPEVVQPSAPAPEAAAPQAPSSAATEAASPKPPAKTATSRGTAEPQVNAATSGSGVEPATAGKAAPAEVPAPAPEGAAPARRPPAGGGSGSGGSGSRRPTAGATAEGEGNAFQHEYHPEAPPPEVVRGRGSGVRPEASGSPVSERPVPARGTEPGAGEAFGEASDSTSDAGRSPSGPDELNAADPALAAEVQEPGGPSSLSPREVWEPPAGSRRRPPASASLDERRAWLRERLEAHRDQAVERYQTRGLTEGQEAALGEQPGLQPAFRGSRIDQFAKDTIMQDPELAEIITAPDFFSEPDILDSVLPDWFDLTTAAAWADHVRRYAGRYGTAAHLLNTNP